MEHIEFDHTISSLKITHVWIITEDTKEFLIEESIGHCRTHYNAFKEKSYTDLRGYFYSDECKVIATRFIPKKYLKKIESGLDKANLLALYFSNNSYNPSDYPEYSQEDIMVGV